MKLKAALSRLKVRFQKEHTNTEKIVWACLFHGFAWVDCSFLLAFLEKDKIAEELSTTAVTAIIGVVLIYATKEGVANLSKNNSWPDKPPKPKEDEEGRTI